MTGKGNTVQDGSDATFAVADVREAFANQVAYCRNNRATVTARVVAAIAAVLETWQGGAFIDRIRAWPGAALADGLPLRAAAAFHALHLSGRAEQLAAIYADEPADDAAIVADAARAFEDALLPWLDSPPQTNEAGRSSNFVAAMLWLSGQGLPACFECLEIGASAGVNLMMDRYGYDLGGVQVGPSDPAIYLAPEWRGDPPGDASFSFAGLTGCDVAPIDLCEPAEALRLKAFVWPEHGERFARIEAAIADAARRKPDLVRMNAADFVESRLALPPETGSTRVLMHSIVWQYLPEDQRRRVTHAMEQAGARASADRALAWVSLEADRTLLHHRLVVRHWPSGPEPRLLATAHAHGAWIDWCEG